VAVSGDQKSTVGRQDFDALVDPDLWETGVAEGEPRTIYSWRGQRVCVCMSPIMAEAIVLEHNACVQIAQQMRRAARANAEALA
jgi:hypothetical protein